MKQAEEVRAFKNELKNLHFYEHRVKKLNELVEYCYHMLGGIKGVDTTKEPSQSHVKNLDAEYKIRDEIEHHLNNIKKTQSRIDDINRTLNLIDEEWVRKSIVSLFADGETLEKVGERVGYSASSLQYIVNKAIKKALN